MSNEDKLKQDMHILLGQIDAICFPLVDGYNSSYYDLIDSIKSQYVSILKRTVGYEE